MSLRAPRRLVAAAAVPALLAGVAIAAPANAAPAAEEPKYKGAAFALQTKLGIGGENLLDLQLPDAVVFPAGGAKNLLGLPPELADLATLKVLNASAGLTELKFAANSSTTGLSILQGLIGAKVLNADCLADRLDVSGESLIAGLELAGTKIPIDTDSPNVKIELPKELSALLSGVITIDEQNLLPGGGMQIRALHVELVIAPEALGAALKAVNETVRAVAKQLVAVVEEATGQSLSSLLAQTNGAAPHGGAQADRGIRSQAVATKAAKAQKSEQAAKAEKAAIARKAAKETSAREASVAQQETTSTVAAGQAGTAEQASVSKADEASVARQSAAEQASTDAAMARRAERGAKPAEASAATEQQQADDAAAAARAENGTAQGQAEQARVEQAPAAPSADERAARTDRALAAERTAKAEQKAAAAKQAEEVRAERTASVKSDGADLRTADRTTARAAAPKAKDAVTGLIDLEVIVSEVNCTGAKLAAPPKRELPNTGGADLAGDMAVTGLGLLLAGSTVAFATRRRREH